MKLLHCNLCHDIILLTSKPRTCLCGQSQGQYIDDLNVEYSGQGIILGIDNKSFKKAKAIFQMSTLLEGELEHNRGIHFEAFIILENTPTIKKTELCESSKENQG